METTTIAQGGQSAVLTELKSYTLVKGFHHSSEKHTNNNIKENHKKGRTQEYTYYKNVCEGWGYGWGAKTGFEFSTSHLIQTHVRDYIRNCVQESKMVFSYTL